MSTFTGETELGPEPEEAQGFHFEPAASQEHTPSAQENEPEVLPAFIYNAMLCENVGDAVDLNFFEPRYREMCRRMGAFGGGDPRFLFVPHLRQDNYPSVGDACYVVAVQQMANLGTFLVRGRCTGVGVVAASWVEPLSGGLHMVRFLPQPGPRPQRFLCRTRDFSAVALPPQQQAGEGAATEREEPDLLRLWGALRAEAQERCGDWSHCTDSSVQEGFSFRKGERALRASVRRLRPRAAACVVVRNVPFHVGLALLGAPADVSLMRASLAELAQRRLGTDAAGVLEAMAAPPRPEPPAEDEDGGERIVEDEPAEAPLVNRALAARQWQPDPSLLVSMETLLRVLQRTPEVDLAPSPGAHPDAWTPPLDAMARAYARDARPRELKRVLSAFLKADVAGVVEKSELDDLFASLLVQKWRRRHLAAAVFNRFLKPRLRCAQVAEMGLCGTTLSTAHLHVYPMVGLRTGIQASLEAANYFERMGPRVEETIRRQLPDALTSPNEGVVHLANGRSGNVNLCLLPQDVLLDAGEALDALRGFTQDNVWVAGCRLLWVGHLHPEATHSGGEPSPLRRLHPELLCRVGSFLTFPRNDRCWQL